MGKAEVRVALYPLGTQNKRLLYFGRAEVYVAPIWVPQSKPRFICLLWGERRYELLSMIEQSDIIRAISLPNAPSSVNTTSLSNATLPNAARPLNSSNAAPLLPNLSVGATCRPLNCRALPVL